METPLGLELVLKYMSKITIEGEIYHATSGESILAVANRENHYLGEVCFQGNCAGCLVELCENAHEQLETPSIKESEVLKVLNKSPERFRLACQAKIIRLPIEVKKPL